MKQRVHFLTYLVKAKVDFSNPQEKAAVMIPANSEVTHISFCIDEASESGVNASIGYEDAPDALSVSIDCAKEGGVNIINRIWQTKKNEEVCVSILGTATKGSGTLRVGYYLPSTTILEL